MENHIETIVTHSLEAAEYNMTYIVGLYYEASPQSFNYTRAVTKYGCTEPYKASPVDRRYWDRVMEEPALAVANLSTHYPIWGIAWDFEPYLSKESSRLYSFDEPALEAFANISGSKILSLPAHQSYYWLKANGLLEAYETWQRETAYSFARDLEEKVHSINPNLSLGLLCFQEWKWTHWAVLEGFNSSTAPLTAWTEETYGGFTQEIFDRLQQAFSQHRLNGYILPGRCSRMSSDPGEAWTMVTNLAHAMREADSVWVFLYGSTAITLMSPYIATGLNSSTASSSSTEQGQTLFPFSIHIRGLR